MTSFSNLFTHITHVPWKRILLDGIRDSYEINTEGIDLSKILSAILPNFLNQKGAEVCNFVPSEKQISQKGVVFFETYLGLRKFLLEDGLDKCEEQIAILNHGLRLISFPLKDIGEVESIIDWMLGDIFFWLIRDVEMLKAIEIFISETERNRIYANVDLFEKYIEEDMTTWSIFIFDPLENTIQPVPKVDNFLQRVWPIRSLSLKIDDWEGIVGKTIVENSQIWFPVQSLETKEDIHSLGHFWSVWSTRLPVWWSNISISPIRCGWFSSNSADESRVRCFCEWIERFSSQEWGFKSSSKIVDPGIVSGLIWYTYESNWAIALPVQKLEYRKNFVFWEPQFSIPSDVCCYPIKRISDTQHYSNSSGIWAWSNYYNAMLSGIFELFERDSVVATWVHKLSPDFIEKTSLPVQMRERIKKVEEYTNWTFWLFDVSYDKNFPHIFGVMYWVKNGIFLFKTWASSWLNLDKCINKTIDEIEMGVSFEEIAAMDFVSIEDVTNVIHHKRFYSEKSNFDKLQFLFLWKNIKYEELVMWNREEKELLGDIFDWRNDEFYIINLSTSYSIGLGIFIVRIFSKNLIPIWFWKNAKLPMNKKRWNDSSIFSKWKKSGEVVTLPLFLHFFD